MKNGTKMNRGFFLLSQRGSKEDYFAKFFSLACHNLFLSQTRSKTRMRNPVCTTTSVDFLAIICIKKCFIFVHLFPIQINNITSHNSNKKRTKMPESIFSPRRPPGKHLMENCGRPMAANL